jgi:hypothetical protein
MLGLREPLNELERWPVEAAGRDLLDCEGVVARLEGCFESREAALGREVSREPVLGRVVSRAPVLGREVLPPARSP